MDEQYKLKWTNSCRLCLVDDDIMIPIFEEEGIERQISHKMGTCFPISVYKTDPLPKMICHKCLYNLETTYEFRKNCLEVINKINEQLMDFKHLPVVKEYLHTLDNEKCSEKVKSMPKNCSVVAPALLPPQASNTHASNTNENVFQEVFLQEASCDGFFSEQCVDESVPESQSVPESPDTLLILDSKSRKTDTLQGNSKKAARKISIDNTVEIPVILLADHTDINQPVQNQEPSKETNIVGSTKTSHEITKPNAKNSIEGKKKLRNSLNSSVRTNQALENLALVIQTVASDSGILEQPSKETQESIAVVENAESQVSQVSQPPSMFLEIKNKDIDESQNTHFNCKACFKSFKNKAVLLRHNRHFCKSTKFSCKFCSTNFERLDELYRHQKCHIGVLVGLKDKELSNCHLCKKKFSNKSMLSLHMRVHKPRKSASINKLQEVGTAQQSESQINHEPPQDLNKSEAIQIKLPTEPPLYNNSKASWMMKCNCKYCGMLCLNSSALWKHMIETHSFTNTKFPCHRCSLSYSSESGLKQHMKTHKKKKPVHPTTNFIGTESTSKSIQQDLSPKKPSGNNYYTE